MQQFANQSKWSHIYTSLDSQVKENQPIIFSKIPESASKEEIEAVIKELNSLYNFKNYVISCNNQNIKGVKKGE